MAKSSEIIGGAGKLQTGASWNITTGCPHCGESFQVTFRHQHIRDRYADGGTGQRVIVDAQADHLCLDVPFGW